MPAPVTRPCFVLGFFMSSSCLVMSTDILSPVNSTLPPSLLLPFQIINISIKTMIQDHYAALSATKHAAVDTVYSNTLLSCMTTS